MNSSKLRLFLLAGSVALAVAGCHNTKQAAKTVEPAPVVAPPAAPVAELTVLPASIEKGQSAQLTWNTRNATRINIDGIGTVEASGSRRVSPSDSTTYQLKATGDGGSTESSARLTVNTTTAVVSDLSEEELFKRSVKDVFFSYDQYDIRPDEQPAVTSDVSFLVQHPRVHVLIEGHCDERGSDEYNMGLGTDRASRVKEELVQHGVSADRIKTISYGKEKPFCTTENENCFQQNRRAHFVFTN